MGNQPLVSVCTITFNHEQYIAQCLDSILSQKVDFEYEILVYDDASTDKTGNILRKYQEKHPKIIKCIINQKNQYSQGVRGISPRFNFRRAQGKYLALLEGDDFWNDDNKLQKQVDFLEENREYNMAMHSAHVLQNERRVKIHPSESVDTLTITDVIRGNIGPTCSQVFRKSIITDHVFEVLKKAPVGDWIFQFAACQDNKKIRFESSPLATYRIHSGGAWSSKSHISKVIDQLTVIDEIAPQIVEDIVKMKVYKKNRRDLLMSLAKAYIFNKRYILGIKYYFKSLI